MMPPRPEIKPAIDTEPRVFRLRTYKQLQGYPAPPGTLDDRNARFLPPRITGVSFFDKQRNANFGYWTPLDRGHGADKHSPFTTILSPKIKEAAPPPHSFKAFGQDPGLGPARKAPKTNGADH